MGGGGDDGGASYRMQQQIDQQNRERMQLRNDAYVSLLETLRGEAGGANWGESNAGQPGIAQSGQGNPNGTPHSLNDNIPVPPPMPVPGKRRGMY